MTKTNKIINGVDVSECVYAILPEKQCPAKSMPYAKETSCIACKEHNTKHNFCKNNPKCNFKRLKRKEQECKDLKDKNEYLINTYIHFKNEIKKYKKAVHKYKVVLQDKIKHLHLSRREFLEEINCVLTRIACKDEEFKNVLDKFNNDIPMINNEDKYKQALDEIEKIVSADYYDDSWGTLAIKIDSIKEIINKAKEEK